MSTAQRATYRVLAVDDEEKIRDAYRLTLCPPDDLEERSVELAELESKLFETTAAKTKKPGFDVELCSQGVDAIQAVREGLDAGAPFAVAFIDVRMPPGIDGIETAIRIREIDPNINIVIVTGYSDHHPAQIADRVPPADKLLYYQKPLQAVELEQLARALAGRWHADREIASAAGRLNHLLTSSPIVIYSREAEEPRAITYISENVVTQLGHPTGDFLADSSFWARHIHPSDQPDVLARSQACSDDFHSIQYRFLDSNGAYRWLRDEFALIRDKADKVVEIVGSWTDITNQKAIESQLIQARKMEAVGQLTGGIAHDFNNMLAAILGNLEMLGDHLEGNAKARRSLDIASRAASRAAELTHRLLAFSRQQHLEPQAMDLGKVLSGMRGLLQTTLTEAVEMDMQVSGDLQPVLADPAQLESTILNLAINARDAMPEGGRLVIESTNTDLDEAYAAEHAEVVPGSYVMLAVSDNGLGMPPDVKERVFEPFFTTKDVGEGTGLGLSTIYGFIKQLGGHVTLYSEEGHGTCVKLYLPVATDPETVSLESCTSRDDYQGGAETVLVVEDDADVSATALVLLEHLGYRVLLAESGPAALRLLEEHRDIDLLFTDVVMPGGMSGLDLAREVSGRIPNLKVLCTSGYSERALAKDGNVPREIEWIGKPYLHRALAAKVRQVLDKPQA